jgi:predicted lipid-binding transport protein (Tim44 family)
MPYVPRQATTAQCAHCKASFEKKHASRKYCSNSCNVQANYARNGRPSDGRATRADLELALAKMTQLVELVTGKSVPTAKKVATKPAAPAAKAAVTPAKSPKKTVSTSKKGITPPAPAAEAAATKPKKKISSPAPRKPAAKAAATKPKKKKTTPVTKLVPFVDVSPAEVKAMRARIEESDSSAGGMNIAEEVDRMLKREVARRRRAAGLPKI